MEANTEMFKKLPLMKLEDFTNYNDFDILYRENKHLFKTIAEKWGPKIDKLGKNAQPYGTMKEWFKSQVPSLVLEAGQSIRSLVDCCKYVSIMCLCATDWEPEPLRFSTGKEIMVHKMLVEEILPDVVAPSSLPILKESGGIAMEKPLPPGPPSLEDRMLKMEQMLAQIAANTGNNVCDNDQRRPIGDGNESGSGAYPTGNAYAAGQSNAVGIGARAMPIVNANQAGESNVVGNGARAISFSSPPPRPPPPLPTGSSETTSLNAILEAIRSTSNVQATQRALLSPGLDAPEEADPRPRPLDSNAMIYRPREWHARAVDEVHRQLLMQNLRSRFRTGVKKINYQLEHLLQVVDFLLQEDLEGAYDIINDRMLFLLKCEYKSLEEAAIYYDELRANTDKDTKHRDAEVQAALKVRGKQGARGGGRFTADEHDFFRRGRGRSRDRRDPPQRAHSTPAANPFVEQSQQGGEQSQGGGTGGRRSRRQWRRRGGH